MNSEKAPSKNVNSTSHHASNGSELIPAEIQAHIRHHDDALPTSNVAIPGTTVDDEGLINNFATEPRVYPATYPSSRQQRRYIFLGAGAILLVAFLVWVSFSVS